MKSLFSQIIAAVAGLWTASSFVPGAIIEINSEYNFFVKPVLNAITLPLRIITLGFFSIVVSMAMIWILDLMFLEVSIPWLYPLLWTTLIVWGINLILHFFLQEK